MAMAWRGLERAAARAGAGAMLLAMVACASAVSTESSGFLGDYSQLVPSPRVDGRMVYIKPGFSLGQYDKLLIDPVLVFFNPQAERRGIDPAVLDELASYFREEALEAIAPHYEVVDEPVPGALRIRAAITDVNPVSGAANVASQVVLKMSVDVGGAAIEVEFLDAMTGERVFAMKDSRDGRRLFNVIQGAQTWGHAKAALRAWAKELRERLDEMHEPDATPQPDSGETGG